METKYKKLAEQGWGEMEQLLDQNMPVERRRAWWWMIPVGLSIAVLAWLLLSKGTQSDQPIAADTVISNSIAQVEDGDRPADMEFEGKQRANDVNHGVEGIKELPVVAYQSGQPEKKLATRNVLNDELIKVSSNPSVITADRTFIKSTNIQSDKISDSKIAAATILNAGVVGVSIKDTNEGSQVSDRQDIINVDALPQATLALLDNKQNLASKEISVLQPKSQTSKLEWLTGLNLTQSFDNTDRALGLDFAANVHISKRFSVVPKLAVNRTFYQEEISKNEFVMEDGSVPGRTEPTGVEFKGSFFDPSFGLALGYKPLDKLMIYTGLRGHLFTSKTYIDEIEVKNPETEIESVALTSSDNAFLKDNGIEFDRFSDEYKIKLSNHFSLDAGIQLNLGSSFYTQAGVLYRINQVAQPLADLRGQGYLTAGLRF